VSSFVTDQFCTYADRVLAREEHVATPDLLFCDARHRDAVVKAANQHPSLAFLRSTPCLIIGGDANYPQNPDNALNVIHSFSYEMQFIPDYLSILVDAFKIASAETAQPTPAKVDRVSCPFAAELKRTATKQTTDCKVLLTPV